MVTSSVAAKLCSSNFPLDVGDTHFFTGFLIVLIPFSFRQIDARELRPSLSANSFPLALLLVSVTLSSI